MSGNDEKMMILKMVSEGKITADDASKLLIALNLEDDNKKKKKEEEKKEAKFLRVRITDTDSDKVRANIKIPISILHVGSKFGSKFTQKIEGIETEDLMAAIDRGQVGQIVDIYDDDDGEHVEVFIE